MVKKGSVLKKGDKADSRIKLIIGIILLLLILISAFVIVYDFFRSDSKSNRNNISGKVSLDIDIPKNSEPRIVSWFKNLFR